jgi:NADH:ubiquinone oxidoreductase subunit H
VPQQFFPSSSRPALVIDLRLKEGSSLAATIEQVKKMETALAKDKDVKFFTEIVRQQGNFFGLGWYIFLPMLTLSFIIYFISALAEAGRAPFDLPETENELIGGFATEYGAMKFGLFFGAEYVHMIVISCIATSLFLGGWQGPLALQIPFLQPVYFFLKVAVMIFMFIWIRVSIPRVRFDKMMRFCWKFFAAVGNGQCGCYGSLCHLEVWLAL